MKRGRNPWRRKKEKRDEQIKENMGLVYACAARLRDKGVEYDELVQAGCVGLILACDRFDPERGFRFSTYAVPLILGEMRRLFREGGSVRVSRRMRDLAKRARDYMDEKSRQGAPPSMDEVADFSGGTKGRSGPGAVGHPYAGFPDRKRGGGRIRARTGGAGAR